ncbi:hypothetical protein AAKU61_004338, partial [Undibacterium sp. GrIS 1.2]|uniref:hypothetical protein n=1 Tax=Undibacterium sp. GrIS 1.2 TaxID=3143933 RepID=UPI00339605EC
MKRRHFIYLLGITGNLIALRGIAQIQAGEPIPLPVANLRYSTPKKYYSIYDPGNYVFIENRIQQKLWGAGHVGPKGGAMMSIYCGNVDVDLQGHILGADFGVSGVWHSVKQNMDSAKRFPEHYTAASLDNRMVRLHNGTIDLARGEDTGDGVVFNNEWQANTSRGYLGDSSLVARPFIWQGQTKIPLIDIPYERNDYTLEKLKVLAHDVAVLLEGSHSVIRDCIIESAGGAAVIIA